jgi:hypothetical protein
VATCFIFTNPTVDQAPFAWNVLHERYRIPRAETIAETAHNVWEIFQFGSYTDELAYTGTGPGAPTVIQPNGLRYYRGGYEHMVTAQDMADLIASGLVTSSNFTPCPGSFGSGGFGSGPYGGGNFGM